MTWADRRRVRLRFWIAGWLKEAAWWLEHPAGHRESTADLPSEDSWPREPFVFLPMPSETDAATWGPDHPSYDEMGQ